jgi:hypothetical protein
LKCLVDTSNDICSSAALKGPPQGPSSLLVMRVGAIATGLPPPYRVPRGPLAGPPQVKLKSRRAVMRLRSGALAVGLVCVGTAALLCVVLHSVPTALLQGGSNGWEPAMARQSGLFSWDNAEVNEGGVAWGQLDCYSTGAPWESRALGCGRPGGCGAVAPGPAESNVPACGASSERCVESFKTCLHSMNPVNKVPTPDQCDCHGDLVAAGCSANCAGAIFASYGQVTRRCFGFNAYDGCRCATLRPACRSSAVARS